MIMMTEVISILAILGFLPSLGEFFDMIGSFFGHFCCGGGLLISGIIGVSLFMYFLKRRKQKR